MDSDWDPDINFEDALEQQTDCNISFSDYGNEIGDGFEANNSSENVSTVDPIDRLELASMIAPLQPNKIGILKVPDDDKKADEKEVTYWLRVSGFEAEQPNLKLNSKNTNKMIPIAAGLQAVSGVDNMFLDDDFFKLRAKPSQLLPMPTNTDKSHQANEPVASLILNNDSCNNQLDSIIPISSAMERDVPKQNGSCEAEDIFYTPRQVYNMKKKKSRSMKVKSLSRGTNGL